MKVTVNTWTKSAASRLTVVNSGWTREPHNRLPEDAQGELTAI